VVILGAGRNVSGNLPSAVVSIDEGHRVLDWLLATFGALGGPQVPQVHFVGGYKVDEVAELYPDILFSFNPDWEVTGPARSLSLVPLASESATFVSYSDVLFRPDAVRRLDGDAGDVVLAVDSQWRVRYDGRSRAELDSAEKLQLDGGQLVDRRRAAGRHRQAGAHRPRERRVRWSAQALGPDGGTARERTAQRCLPGPGRAS
jgi:choline kinase